MASITVHITPEMIARWILEDADYSDRLRWILALSDDPRARELSDAIDCQERELIVALLSGLLDAETD